MNVNTITGLSSNNERMIVDGQLGAYAVHDSRENFYIVRWIGSPRTTQGSERHDLSGETYHINEGKTICKGLWYRKFEDNWYYPEERETIVKMSSVLIANLHFEPLSNGNPLPTSVGKKE